MTSAATIPGYRVGTWNIDPVHSTISFSVRHMMINRIRGHFGSFTGTIVTAENLSDNTVSAEIDLASIDTYNEQRDGHVKSPEFFDVENHPKMTFQSTSVSVVGDNATITGDLTIKGITKSVDLAVTLGGFGQDPYGGNRIGLEATTTINRSDFGVDISMPLPTGGLLVGDEISITIDIEAVLAES